MKLALLSESEADETAARILVEGILGRQTKPAAPPAVRSRGWPAVANVLPAVLRHLYYRTDADALVVIVDSDLCAVHSESDPTCGRGASDCRLCALRAIVAHVQEELATKALRAAVKTALGLAVPQIEAWYLVGRDPHVSEAAWVTARREGRVPYTSVDLKRVVYGTDRPSLALEKQRAREEAERIVREEKLAVLEEWFPNGFGPLARDVRLW